METRSFHGILGECPANLLAGISPDTGLTPS